MSADENRNEQVEEELKAAAEAAPEEETATEGSAEAGPESEIEALKAQAQEFQELEGLHQEALVLDLEEALVLEVHQVAQVHQEARQEAHQDQEELHQEAQALVLEDLEGLEALSQVSQELMLIRQLALVQQLLDLMFKALQLFQVQIMQLH